MLLYLLQGLTLGISAAATPGPFQAFLLSQSAQNGWRRTLPAAFSPLVSDGPIIVLVVFILTRVPGGLMEALRFGGGMYLLYLAWKSFQAAGRSHAGVNAMPKPAGGTVMQAAILNLLNPNPYIFWSLIGGPVLLRGWHQSAGCCLAFLGGIYTALIGGSACLVILFAVATRLEQKVNRALLYISAVALALFGLYQLFGAITGLMKYFS
jgi:threonine/homoserine/homoserine lactone efflux protein